MRLPLISYDDLSLLLFIDIGLPCGSAHSRQFFFCLMWPVTVPDPAIAIENVSNAYKNRFKKLFVLLAHEVSCLSHSIYLFIFLCMKYESSRRFAYRAPSDLIFSFLIYIEFIQIDSKRKSKMKQMKKLNEINVKLPTVQTHSLVRKGKKSRKSKWVPLHFSPVISVSNDSTKITLENVDLLNILSSL